MKTKLYNERTAKELATQSANRLQEEAISKFKEIKKSMRSNPCVQALLLALKDSLKKSTPMFVIFDNNGRYQESYYTSDDFHKHKYTIKAVESGISFIYWSEGKTWHEDYLFKDFDLPDGFGFIYNNDSRSKEKRYALIAFITILYEEVFNTFSVELLMSADHTLKVSNLDSVIFDRLFNYKVLRVDDVNLAFSEYSCMEKYFFRRFLSYGVWGVFEPYCCDRLDTSEIFTKYKLEFHDSYYIVGVRFSEGKICSEEQEYEDNIKRSWY